MDPNSGMREAKRTSCRFIEIKKGNRKQNQGQNTEHQKTGENTWEEPSYDKKTTIKYCKGGV